MEVLPICKHLAASRSGQLFAPTSQTWFRPIACRESFNQAHADQITSSMDPRLKGNICLFRVWLGISELMIVRDAGDYEAAGFIGRHGILLFPYIMNMAFD